jgi:hypothetical protein
MTLYPGVAGMGPLPSAAQTSNLGVVNSGD